MATGHPKPRRVVSVAGTRKQSYVTVVAGRETKVDLVWTGDGSVSYSINGRTGTARVRRCDEDRTQIFNTGLRAIPISVRDTGAGYDVRHGLHHLDVSVYREDQILLEKISGGLTAGGGSLKSSMPGRIVSVLKEVGAHVQAGEVVVILEAMKMENQVKAPRDGVIQKICVQVDQAVESGTLLMEIGDDV
jgi:pyruvate carboxylase subunit B